MTRRRYTKLTARQRLLIAQIIAEFPDAKASAIAKVASCSAGTVYNVARPLLVESGYFNED